jgi:starvation-inducible DNA-binding protein
MTPTVKTQHPVKSQRRSAPAAPTAYGRIIEDLNAQLSHLLDLAAAAKQAHWNVKGPSFQSLHLLFDEAATEARDFADEVAERAVTLGGLAHGTVQDVGAATTLDAYPTDASDWQVLTRELLTRYRRVASRFRTSADGMDDEPATQDLYIGIVQGLEKRAWMIEAHLR